MNFLNKLKKVKNIILLITFIFTNISFSSAQEISEIMYDPVGSDTGNEWIEIYNNSDIPTELTICKLFEANVEHKISTTTSYTNPISSSLLPGEYAVIADNPANFLSKNNGFSGKLFDSSFSLSNSGELLELRDSDSLVLSSVNYVQQAGSNGTDNTLNYINGSWISSPKTPGLPPGISSSSSGTNTTPLGCRVLSTNNGSATTSTITASSGGSSMGSYLSYTGTGSNRFTLGDLRLLVPREINTVVGAETEFFVKNIDNKNSIVTANTYWSFGDGAEGIGTTTTHRYQNAGVYNAFIESQVSNSYGVDRIMVKVENPNIEISDVQDNYVELYNKSDVELNIGRFIIASDQGFYQLSRMFVISSQSKVKIDGRVLGFSKLTNVKLMSAYNTFITKYENKNILLNNNLQNNIFATSSNFNILASASANSSAANTTFTNKNKITYKKPVKIVSAGLIPKQNPKLIIMGTSTNSELKVDNKVIEVSVDKKSSIFIKKWLYWIYE